MAKAKNEVAAAAGAVEKKASKKSKKDRIPFPALKVDAEGKATVKLKEYPKDFNAKIHKRLRPSDFENAAPLYKQRAAMMRKRAEVFDMRADEAMYEDGSPEALKLKLVRMLKRATEMKAQLEAEGIDISSLMS
jgi:hypothetical protein